MTRKKPRFDFTSVAGVPLGIGLILLGQALEGGSPRSLVQATAALIVFGGTAGALLVSFSYAEVRHALASLRTVFLWQGEPHARTIDTVIQHAVRARKEGILALENELPNIPDPFLQKAMAYVVDGTDPVMLRDMLEAENVNREEHDEIPARVWEAAGGYAPTLGILGAVLGLIQIMQHLTDPSKLGAGIAVAFVATVYGVGSANLIFLPMATKLKRKARHERLRRELMLEGALAIQDGTNHRLIGEKLRGLATQATEPDRLRQAA